MGGLQGALRLARDALPRLRLHRRRDLGRQRVGRPLGPRRLRGAAAADAQDAGGLPPAHAAQRPEAPRRGRDDPDAERLARARQPAAQGALDGGHAEPLGHGRRARRLHRRPLAARAAARAGDRPRARPLAGGARPARPRGALPRHRQAGDPRRDPAQAGEPDRGRVGADAAPRRRGRAHHRPSRLPERRRPGDPAPPRALRRRRLSGRAEGRGDPARRPDHPRRRRARLDADDPHLPRREAGLGGARRAPPRRRHPVLPALRRGARADPADRGHRRRGPAPAACWSRPSSATLAIVCKR